MKHLVGFLYSIYPIWIIIGIFVYRIFYEKLAFDSTLLLILLLVSCPIMIPALILYFALIIKDNSYLKIIVNKGKVKTVVDKELNHLEVIEVTKIERHPKYNRFVVIEPWSIFGCIEIKTKNGNYYVSSMSSRFKDINFFDKVKYKKYTFPGEINI